ncbi:hypothetical protein Fleli_3751 [Bernardetia litoralis DSM 6794]|uniref:Uncharacterized protein n=1 Tax=Bernardetia litoralis (strain ATCC 23117 / DSM 6794 / NBRC 15988 / NCIMB 1366 / Fx l1 / Sio-4) TaxID=880071 RepID=I4AQ28_BERLS|nr:hypothetical protein [Bernardetia litoralis]AFM06063.1 hypothetical protein Fleli_3751 [Bernardetia litoralis DSM 6794]
MSVDDIGVMIGSITGVFFPVIVLLISRFINFKKGSRWIILIPSFLILLFFILGFELYNKLIELLLVLLSLITLFVYLDQITKRIIPRSVKYVIGGVYIIPNFFLFILWIFGIGDYLAPIKYADIQSRNYKITIRATGNFSDIQVKCDLRKEYINNLAYKTIDEVLIKEVQIKDLISFEETDNSFVITCKNGEIAKLEKNTQP